MALLRRRRSTPEPSPPTRPTHPDPAIEAKLQQLDSLRQRVKDKEEQVKQYGYEIAQLHILNRELSADAASGYSSYDSCQGQIESNDGRIEALASATTQLEQEIDTAHERIVALIADLSKTVEKEFLSYFIQ